MPFFRPTLTAALSVVAALAFAACSDSGSDPDPTSTPAGVPTSAATPPAGTATASAGPIEVTGEVVASGLSRPTFVTHAGDGSGRLFVLEKPGRIRIIANGGLTSTPFLDITGVVGSSGNEQGLLGLAFHPEFESNGRFFVAYTAKDSKNTVAEYRASSNGNVAEPASGRVLMAVADQYPNHNGGMLAFGPDGYLYISMGDGGSSGDPLGSGQDLNSLLGKLLRVDVDGAEPYGIPAANPFRNQNGARPEVWAYGLRNPWRFSFDSETGDIWIADVGQNKWEEIDFQPSDSEGGENYGWNTMEGAHCYRPAEGCNTAGLVLPVFEYDHGAGCSVTGGYVYRGSASPRLAGQYLFTDYCTPTLWATGRTSDGGFETEEIGKLPDGVSAFGEDEDGELYITVDREGTVYRLSAK